MTDLATVTVTPPAAAPDDPPRGSLLRAEIHRFRSRRFIQVVIALALVGYALIIALASAAEFGKTTPEQLAAAERNIAEIIEEQERFREQCLREPNRPTDVPDDMFCGPPNTAENFPVEQFLDKQPFVLADALPAGAIAVAAASAVLAFVLGSTYVGAEWSSRSMVALLFWEPRRFKVMRVKLAVLAGAAVVLAMIGQALWWGTALVMARYLGRTGTLPEDFYPDLLGQQGRSVLLVVLTALLGFGLSNLVRNTGAALGIGFVYFAIVENAVRAIRGSWQ